MKKNIKNILIALMLIANVAILNTGCKKSDNDPQPSVVNNPGGGGNNSAAYFTDPTMDFTCDELYEDVNFKGHTFRLTTGLCASNDEVTYRQYVTGKNNAAIPYVDATVYTGSIRDYNTSTSSYDVYSTVKAEDIQTAITTNGSYKIPQVGDNNPAWGTIDPSIKTGFYLKNSGYDPDVNAVHNCWSVNVNQTNEFYYEITKIQRKYSKEMSSDPYYVIEGRKKILLRYYNGEDGIPYHDTLTTTFKVVKTFNENN